MVDVDLTTDACNYDVITHVEEAASGKDHDKSKSNGETTKDKRYCALESSTLNTEVEYSVPNKVKKKDKNDKALARSNEGPKGEEYNRLMHDMASSGQQLSVQHLPPSSQYSQIDPEDTKRKSFSTLGVKEKSPSTSGRRSRTCSPPGEPPPLPPPFVDDEMSAANNSTLGLQPADLTAALTKRSEENLGAMYGNGLQTVYDDPEGINDTQELYMNVGKK